MFVSTISPIRCSGRRCLSSVHKSIVSASKRDLVKDLPKEVQEDVARAIDLADKAVATWSIEHTNFLTPFAVNAVMSMIERLASVSTIPWGGYPQAERCRMIIGREEILDGFDDDRAAVGEVVAVKIEGNFLFDTASHGDFLGAAIGSGIAREVLGDIVVQGDRGAVLFTTPEVSKHLEAVLTKVRTVPVSTREVALGDLNLPAPKTKEVKTSEASLRLDAVASSGFGVSREKMSKMIKSGDVRVNWADETRGAVLVKDGDIISCRGKGRIEVHVAGKTKKGRYSLNIVRFL